MKKIDKFEFELYSTKEANFDRPNFNEWKIKETNIIIPDTIKYILERLNEIIEQVNIE